MIDTKARNKCAELLRRIFTDDISNYELEDSWPEETCDLAVSTIGEQIWIYYNDFPEERLKRLDFSPEVQQLLERCILFLESGLEYEWPLYSFATQNLKWFHCIFKFATKRHARSELDRFKSAGDITVWPFLRRKDYEEELEFAQSSASCARASAQ